MKPPPHFIVHCDSIINSLKKTPLLKQYEITTYTFKDYSQFERHKSPNYLVDEVDCIVAINIYKANPKEFGYTNLKEGLTIRLTFKEIDSKRSMNLYFRLCKEFIAGESIELSSFSFMQGDYFFDTYDTKYKIKNWLNTLKSIKKVENLCNDYGHFIFVISDYKKHKISKRKLKKLIKKDKCD